MDRPAHLKGQHILTVKEEFLTNKAIALGVDKTNAEGLFLAGRLGRLLEAQERSPEEAAAKFMRHFAAQYGASTPHWQTRSWADSSRLAHSQFKFLFIYLHAPNHQVIALCFWQPFEGILPKF